MKHGRRRPPVQRPSWGLYTTTTFTITTAGNYTIRFAGTNNSGDNDSFIDDVSIVDPPPDADNVVIPPPSAALSPGSPSAVGSRSQDPIPAGQPLGWPAASSPVAPSPVGLGSGVGSVTIAAPLQTGAAPATSAPLILGNARCSRPSSSVPRFFGLPA